MNKARLFVENQRVLFEGEILLDEAMSRYTYYRTGGISDYLFIPKSISDLKIISKFLQKFEIPVFVLGMGSNLLVSDQGFRGAVVKTSLIDLTIEENENQIVLGAGLPIVKVLRKAAENDWAGFDFLSGIPGSIGGACFMNAGTHLGETKDQLEALEGYTLSPGFRKMDFKLSDLKYSYRRNNFLPENFIVTKTFWKKEIQSGQKEKIQQILNRREETQPVDIPSCGSVFKNPEKCEYRSWQIIEKLGLRGFKKGDAQFSEKHPNFIVNHGKAKSQDIFDLIQLAKIKAKKDLGIQLEEEVRYLGFH